MTIVLRPNPPLPTNPELLTLVANCEKAKNEWSGVLVLPQTEAGQRSVSDLVGFIKKTDDILLRSSAFQELERLFLREAIGKMLMSWKSPLCRHDEMYQEALIRVFCCMMKTPIDQYLYGYLLSWAKWGMRMWWTKNVTKRWGWLKNSVMPLDPFSEKPGNNSDEINHPLISYDFLEDMQREEINRQVREAVAIAKLTPEQLSLFNRVILNDESAVDVGAEVGLHPNQVWTQIAIAKRKLSDILNPDPVIARLHTYPRVPNVNYSKRQRRWVVIFWHNESKKKLIMGQYKEFEKARARATEIRKNPRLLNEQVIKARNTVAKYKNHRKRVVACP